MKSPKLLFLRKFLATAVFWSFLATGARFGGLILVLPVTIRMLLPSELGLWYVFLSLGGLASLLELGYAQSVSRSVGYLWVGASTLLPKGIACNSNTQKSIPNYEGIICLMTTMRVFYKFIGLAITLLLGVFATPWIWSKTMAIDNSLTLRLAWFMYVVSLGINMTGTLWPAALVGINGVRSSQKIFLCALLLNYGTTIVALLSNFGLWSVVLGSFAQAFTIQQAGRWRFMLLIGKNLSESPAQVDFNLIKVLWPQSWRTAVVSLGTFLILQSNTLVCSTFLGLDTTASYGLSLQLITALSGISAIWVTVKIPLFNQMRAAGKIESLTKILINRIRLSLCTYVVGSVTFILAGKKLLGMLGSRTDLLPTYILMLMLVFYLLECHHSFHVYSILSENQNPFVFPAIFSGITIVLASSFFTPRIGVLGLVLSFGVVQLCFNNWWIVLRNTRGLRLSYSQYLKRLLFFHA